MTSVAAAPMASMQSPEKRNHHAPSTLQLRERIPEYQRRLDSCFKQLAELNEKSKELNQSTPEFTRRREELRLQMEKLSEQMKALEAEKVKLLQRQKDLAAVPVPVNSNTALEDIDQRIRAAERDMMSKRLTAAQESKIIKQISGLRQQRNQVVSDAQTAADRSANARAVAAPLRERLEGLKTELAACQRKRRDLNESLTALMNKRRQTTGPLREIADQRELLQEQIVETRGLLNRARDEITRQQKLFEADQAKQKQQRDEKRAQQRKIDDLVKRKEFLQEKLEDLEGELQSAEFVKTQRMLLYMQSLTKRLEDTAPPMATTATDEPDTEGPPATLDGQVLMAPKAERLANEKQSARRKRYSKKTVVSSPNAPLVHDIQVLADFQKLQLAPPLTLRDCPALVATLSGRLGKLQAEQTEQSDKIAGEKPKIVEEIQQIIQTIENLSSS